MMENDVLSSDIKIKMVYDHATEFSRIYIDVIWCKWRILIDFENESLFLLK